MKQVIEDIMLRLSENAPGLRYIAEDWGQLDTEGEAPVKFPCALVDIDNSSWTNTSENIQIGVLQISIRVAARVPQVSSRAPVAMQKSSLSVWDNIREVHKSLQGWHGSAHYGPLMRTSLRKVRRSDGTKDYVLIYSVALNDNVTMPIYNPVERPVVRMCLEKLE